MALAACRIALVLVFLFAAVMCCTSAVQAQQKISYVDLVNRMTDLERLAVLPAVGEKCGQWSSYDRASKYDETTGKYINWGANSDGNGIIRNEGTRVVMAEMTGPGCIWRIWSAKADKGHVQDLPR